MRLIAPFGFYGAGNIGDEATLQGFARLLKAFDERTRGWVASRHVEHTRRVEPAFRYFRAESRDVRRRLGWMTSHAVVFPGGTPIMDSLGAWPFSELVPFVERAARARMPIAFIGTGTERLGRDESMRTVAESIAPHVVHWTVRCDRDRDRLVQYGVRADAVTPAADMAWLLDPVSTDRGRTVLRSLGVKDEELLIGVNVNFEDAVRAQQPGLLASIAEALDALVADSGARIVFLCNETRDERTFDLASSRDVIAAMRERHRTLIVPNEYYAPQVMMSLIGCCRFTISTRYHFCLFSAKQSIPFVALKRSDKVTDLCEDLAWPHAVSLEDADTARISACMAALAANAATLPQHLQSALPTMRTRAMKNVVALEAIRQHLTDRH